jgi:molybdenum cofactor synthesis domain-containing protein
MQPRVVERAAALIVGNEILSGKVAEANLVELARTLRSLGVTLERVVMLPDTLPTLAPEIRSLSRSHDVVFTSGGVGPTHDDLTIAAVAAAFETNVVEDPTLRALILAAYRERATDTHYRMALVPNGAELAAGPDGTWPIAVMQNVWILPGVPEVFREKLLVVRSFLRGPAPFHSRAVFTRQEEPLIAPSLEEVVKNHPEVDIGSYPRWFEPSYKTKVTLDARDPARVEAALADLLALLPVESIVRVE